MRRIIRCSLLAAAVAVGASVAPAELPEDVGTEFLAVIVAATSAGDAARLVEQAGGTVAMSLPLIDAVAASVPVAELDTLRSAAHVSADHRVAPTGRPGRGRSQTTDLNPAAGLRQAIAAPAGSDGAGVTVAMVDTGVAAVPGLGAVVHGPDLSGDDDGVDRFGHGTFIAGLINGSRTGVAPGAAVVSVKVAGSSGAADVSAVIAGIQWVVLHAEEMSVDVLNLSYGTDADTNLAHDPLVHAVERAWDAGLVVITASGNAGRTLVTNPGVTPAVLTVGALDSSSAASRNDDRIPDWSGRNTSKPELAAPGVSVVSLRAPGTTVDSEVPTARVGPDLFVGSGTSHSAAVTSGAAALLLAARPGLSPDEVKFALTSSGHQVKQTSTQSIDVAAAIAAPPGVVKPTSRASGTGTLDASRGTHRIVIDGAVLTGEMTASGRRWDPASWLRSWTAGSWQAGSWQAGSWQAGSWQAGSWQTSRWGP